MTVDLGYDLGGIFFICEPADDEINLRVFYEYTFENVPSPISSIILYFSLKSTCTTSFINWVLIELIKAEL